MMNNVYVRLIIYILSPILTMLAGLLAGWGVAYDATAHVLTLDLPAVITAIVAATGLSTAVFAKWGIK